VATTTTRLLTVDQFQEIPNPPGGYYELYHGELVPVGYSDLPHARAQWQLRRLLESATGDAGIVEKHVPYRPLPEHEFWQADVAFVSMTRWNATDRHFMGVPELVAEVLSPSNKAREIFDKREICLQNGAREFWIVNLDHRQIDVSTPDGRTVTYKPGQQIPLFFAPGASISLDAVFS
jgi:Uma2 family endonuclease